LPSPPGLTLESRIAFGASLVTSFSFSLFLLPLHHRPTQTSAPHSKNDDQHFKYTTHHHHPRSEEEEEEEEGKQRKKEREKLAAGDLNP
jgi:hypothetical protein